MRKAVPRALLFVSLSNRDSCAPGRRGALHRGVYAVALLGAALIGIRANAQAPTSLRVHVVDSAGVALPNADVTVVHSLHGILAFAVTDSTGRSALSFSGAPGSYQLVVRRLGYHAANRSFTAAPGQTISLAVVLTATAATLAGVTVTARESAKWKSYHIGADEIAQSTRPLFDAVDILTKLRPDMLTSRAPEICADSVAQDKKQPGARHVPVGGLSNVWVNGQRIRVARDDSTWVLVPGSVAAVRPEILEILREIRPQDIEQMSYADCMDTSMPGLGAQNAIFITLKPGVKYEHGRGTSVVTQPSAPAVPAPSPPAGPPRLLGVFAHATGEPIVDATVTALGNGTRAQTSTTGTVILGFLPGGTSDVCVYKRGYRDTTFAVTVSPADTVPITLMLRVDTSGQAAGASRLDTCLHGVSVTTLRGLVFSPDRAYAVGGAEVSLGALGRSTTTSDRGTFELDSLPVGHYLLSVRRLGFAPWEDSVVLMAGQPTTSMVSLRLPAAVLDTVAVAGTRHIALSPSLRGFEERRRTGFGHFMTEDELRKAEGRPLASVIQRMGGLRLVAVGRATYVTSDRSGKNGCYASVYLDGMLIYAGAGKPPDLDRLYTDTFAGIEFYAGGATTPPQFNTTGTGCGVLLLWTRER